MRSREPQALVLPSSNKTRRVASAVTLPVRPVRRSVPLCGACGGELEPGGYFCGYCGVSLRLTIFR